MKVKIKYPGEAKIILKVTQPEKEDLKDILKIVKESSLFSNRQKALAGVLLAGIIEAET